MIMTTEAYYSYKPTIDEIRKALAEEEGQSVKEYPKEFNKILMPELA